MNPDYWYYLTSDERGELNELEKQIHEMCRELTELRDKKRVLVVRAGSRIHRKKE